MPRSYQPYAIGSDALIAGLLQPTQNFGQLTAAKEKQLQQQTYLTQQSEQELLKEQQAAAQIANFKQRIRSLPAERPDKVRIAKWLSGQEKEIAKRLEDVYQGNLGKFIQAEGAQWMEHTLGALEQSPEYQNALSNNESAELYRAAIQSDQHVIGKKVGDTYIPAQQQMLDFLSGKTDKFSFGGSYKDDDELIKHFGSQYAPGKLPYEQTPVSDADKQNFLLATNSPEVAQDKYLRKYQNAEVFYKTKPLDEYQDFQNKQYNQGVKQKMDQARFDGLNLRNELNRSKLNGLKNGGLDSSDPGAYLRHMIPQSTPGPDIEYKKHEELNGSKYLPHSNYDLSTFSGGQSHAKVNFNVLDVFDEHSIESLGSLVGAEKVPVSKTNPTGWRGGSIKEGIIAKGGFNAIDLAGTNHQIVHIDPKIYTNPREFSGGKAVSANGPTGFLKVTIKFNDSSDAKQAGLTGFWGRDEKIGAGAYNSDTRELSVFTPVGSLYKNAALNRFLSNQDAGAKETNKFLNPYALGVDDD